jgi:glycosyltransferase involved in cell wall biosynthesis
MKVAIVIEGFGSGGAERVACVLSKVLAERGFEVVILTIDGVSNRFYAPPDCCSHIDLRLVRRKLPFLKRFLGFHVIRFEKIKEALREINPEVVIPFGSKLNCLVLMALEGQENKPPVIITEHGDPQRGRMEWTYKLLRLKTYPRAKAMVCLTRYAADFWAHRIPNVPTYVIPNPFSLPEGSKDVAKKPEKKGRKIILSVGRLAYQKNYQLLLKAFSLIADKYDDWDVHIYGEGKKRKELIRLAERLGIKDRVFLPGVTDEISTIYLNAEIYVQSSFFEGFPNTLVEAMSLGLPVVVTNWNGVEDLVEDGVNGLVVPFREENLAKAMERLINNENLRCKLGREAQKLKHKLTVEQYGEAWFRVVKENAGCK